MNWKKIYWLAFLLAAGLLAGCARLGGGGAPAPTPTLAPLEVSDTAIIAEGRLIPRDSVHLSFLASGQVKEVLVKEGDLVKAGDVIARLSGREPLEAAISAAEGELLAAQQALKALNDNLEASQNLALQALNQARQVVHDAEKRVKNVSGTASQTDIDIAYTQVVFSRNELSTANDDFSRVANRSEDNLVRARLQVAQAEAQKKYDQAVSRYNNMVGWVNDFDRTQAETDLKVASKQLELAQKDYDKLQAGPDPDALAAANARIRTAESQLVAAKSNLDNLELRATITGTVVELSLIPGEPVTPGAAVALLADFSQWYVETNNLTETDVVDVQVGQAAAIVPDALPDLLLTGRVDAIGSLFEEKRGEINYPVKILLEKIDPRLRWGMTTVITFEQP